MLLIFGEHRLRASFVTGRHLSGAGDHLGRIFRNTAILLGGNVVASVLSAAALALIARSLQPNLFGAFAMIVAFVFVVDNALNFQSWQVVIKFGAERIAAHDNIGLGLLFRRTILLDVGCALAGAILAGVLALVLGRYLGWSADIAQLAACFGLVVVTRATGTATGVLRLWNRFDLLARQQALVGVLRIVAVAGAFAVSGSIGVFLLAWGVAEVVGNIFLIVSGARELNIQGITVPVRREGAVDEQPGFWSFVWTTNIHSSVKLAIKELDVVVLGALAGLGAAGMYKVIKQLGALFVKGSGPLYQAIYPELAAAVAAGDRARFVSSAVRPTYWAAGLALLVLVVYALIGPWMLGWVLGESYAGAFEPSLIYLLGSLIATATFALHPAALALNAPGGSLRVLMFSTVIYGLSFVLLANLRGVEGAAAAFVIFYAVWSVSMIRLVRARFREWTV